MTENAPRLRRTQKGRDEIQQKTHILEQSERMVLVLVNGVTSPEDLQRKVRGMAKRRFKLAIADLIAKGFLEESVLPEDQQPEKLDAAVMERFVRQDPLDPVTVVALRLQSELSRLAKSNEASEPAPHKVSAVPGASEVVEVDFYLPLEVQANDALEPQDGGLASGDSIGVSKTEEWHSPRRVKRERRGRQVQMGYWLLFAGLVVVIVLAIAQRSH